MEVEKRIPLEECVQDGVYALFSRNLSIGVWDERVRGFMGVRRKLGDVYLFIEYHHDTGAPFGTASPIALLEQSIIPVRCPECNELAHHSKRLLTYLITKEPEAQQERDKWLDSLSTGE